MARSPQFVCAAYYSLGTRRAVMCLLAAACAQTAIKNCYTTSSYLVYSADTHIIRLYLDSSQNSLCNSFPNGVQFNLTLGVANSNSFQKVIRDFDYGATREVIFDAIPNLAIIKSAYVRVFDYGFYTDFEIFKVEQQMSNLELCFSDVIFRAHKDKVELDFTSTGECANIFDQNSNILSQVDIVVENEEYMLDKQNFWDNYAGSQPFTVTTTQISKHLLYAPFISSFVRFTLAIESLDLKFNLQIQKYDGQLVKGIIPIALVGQWEQRFFVKAPADPNADIDAFMQIVGDYDEVDYRISFRHGDKLFKFVQSFPGQINHKRAVYRFNCMDIASPAEQEECLYFYDLQLRKVQFDMVFDIIFKKAANFIVKYQQTLLAVESCWRKMTQLVSNSQYCADLEWTNNCPAGVAGDLTFTRVGQTETGIIDDVVVVALPSVHLTPATTRICTEIGENQWLKSTSGYYIEFKIIQNGEDFYALSKTVYRADYRVPQFSSLALGLVVIGYCLYSSISGIITTMKSIRKIKVNKKAVIE